MDAKMLLTQFTSVVIEPPRLRAIYRYRLRSEPQLVPFTFRKRGFGLDDSKKPIEYIDNEYVDCGDGTISDRATGLLWQKSGLGNVNYEKAATYIRQLNRQCFAGHRTWRLPTVPELMSLLEPGDQMNKPAISDLFDKEVAICLSADRDFSGMTWGVSFHTGSVDFCSDQAIDGVRAVLSLPITGDKGRAGLSRSNGSPRYDIRSEPSEVSYYNARTFFNLSMMWSPLDYYENEFSEGCYGSVIDFASGLMWQKKGSAAILNFEKAQEYVSEINRARFAGYGDWRLPTIHELISLVQPEENDDGLFIASVFDKSQTWCWSSDSLPSGYNWGIDFKIPTVDWWSLGVIPYVRAVRSMISNA